MTIIKTAAWWVCIVVGLVFERMAYQLGDWANALYPKGTIPGEPDDY